MSRLIDKGRALNYVGGYFDELTRSGYVKSCATRRMSEYMFIVDFVETLYPFIGENEYHTIGKATLKLFGKDNCLFPYSVSGLPYYMGANSIRRQMNSEETLKRLEVEKLRGI